jgi:DNA-binding response OmpR family regulator
MLFRGLAFALALPAALLPHRLWHRLPGWVPVEPAAFVAGILTLLAGVAVGIPGFLEHATATSSLAIDSQLTEAARNANAGYSQGLSQGFAGLSIFTFLLLTPKGWLTTYLIGTGGLRTGAAWFDDPFGDPILTGIDHLIGASRNRAQARSGHRTREALEGPEIPDRAVTSAKAAIPGCDLMRVLVIEDDRKVANFISTGLEQEGYAIDVLHEGTAAGAQALAYDYDAVVLDLMLPGRSGFQVLRDIRARKATLPILILTAKDSLEERVAGLDSGADDYMVKPFALAELSARLRAVLRRGAARENTLRVADLEMDTVRRLVRRAGRALDLKPKEYALLEFLMRNSDRPVTKSLIIEHVWNIHFDSVSNVVEVHINALRNKIDRGFDRPLIHTIRGVGYILTDAPPDK